MCEGRRHPPRSRRISAERETHEAAGDGDAEPELEPPGTMRGSNGFGHAERRAGAGQPSGELIEVRLTDHDRTRLEDPPNDVRTVNGLVRVGMTASCRHEPGHVDVVFDREGQAVHRRPFSRAGIGFKFGGAAKSASRLTREIHTASSPARSIRASTSSSTALTVNDPKR